MKKLEDERLREKEDRKEGLRRRKEQRAKLHQKTDEELAGYEALSNKTNKGPVGDIVKAPLNGGLWTDDDLTELVRLTKKYPGSKFKTVISNVVC